MAKKPAPPEGITITVNRAQQILLINALTARWEQCNAHVLHATDSAVASYWRDKRIAAGELIDLINPSKPCGCRSGCSCNTGFDNGSQ
jgi:hypothetical protein